MVTDSPEYRAVVPPAVKEVPPVVNETPEVAQPDQAPVPPPRQVPFRPSVVVLVLLVLLVFIIVLRVYFRRTRNAAPTTAATRAEDPDNP